MTFDEAKTRLAQICAGIVQQNHELMGKIDEPGFDPGIGFDNTKNNAGYKLTDFFDIMKAFPYGNVPGEVADDVVSSTDALLARMREKYGRSESILRELIGVGQAFRMHWGLSPFIAYPLRNMFHTIKKRNNFTFFRPHEGIHVVKIRSTVFSRRKKN